MSLLSDISFGLFDTSSPDYGKQAQLVENRRQAQIRQGLAQVNSIFGGGTAPFYSRVKKPVFAPSGQQYYGIGGGGNFFKFNPKGTDGSSFNITNAIRGLMVAPLFGFGALAGLFGTEKPMSALDVLNAQIKGGNVYTREDKTYEGFTPEFFANREKAYVDYAMPQLARQYGDTRNAMIYGNAERGLLRSTAAQKQASDLNYTMGQNQQQIYDTARAQSQELEKELVAQKQAIINQLYQSADPSRAMAAATETAASMRTPSVLTPLGSMFSNLMNQYYMNQMLSSYRPTSFISPQGTNPDYASALPGVYSMGK